MRIKLMLIMASLFAVTMVSGIAGALSSGVEHETGAKLDKLHAMRPIAASARFEGSMTDPDSLLSITPVAAAEAPPPAAPPPEPAPAAPEPPPPPPPPQPVRQQSPVVAMSAPGDSLSCLRARESGGDYTVHNTQGSGASGAYQFMPGTWNGIANLTGRPDLVGLDPAAASPADQDAMAAALYARSGNAPWGGYC